MQLFFFHVYSPLTPLPSMLGASLVSSLFLLGLKIDVALPATLCYAVVFVAEYCPRLLELFVVELHSSIIWHHPFIRPIWSGYIPFTHGEIYFAAAFLDIDYEVARIRWRISKTLVMDNVNLFYPAWKNPGILRVFEPQSERKEINKPSVFPLS